jgi:polyhydroxyalkanoate synthesis regulator phasin
VSKSKVVWLSLLAAVIAVAIAVGVVGCASKTQPAASAPSTSAPSTSGVSTQAGNGSQVHFNPQQMQANVKAALTSLVSNGTITQDQSDKVVQAYAQSLANRQQGSNQQQASGQQASGQQASGQRQNPIIVKLVSNGTLTQSQANAVSQAIRQAMPHGQRPSGSTSGQTTTQ